MLKSLKSIGNVFSKVVGYVSTADKIAKTSSALHKHLKAFDDERMRIWGVSPTKTEVEPQKTTVNE